VVSCVLTREQRTWAWRGFRSSPKASFHAHAGERATGGDIEREHDQAREARGVQAQGFCPRPDFLGLMPDFPVGRIFRPVFCSPKIVAEYLFFKVEDTGFSEGCILRCFSLFGSMACRSLFCVFWVICMVHFQFAFGGCLCLHQVGSAEDQKKRHQDQVKLVEWEVEVWQTGEA
jgi:hypothetical protein